MIKMKGAFIQAMLILTMTTVVFADEAPVYDVDNTDDYPPSFEQSENPPAQPEANDHLADDNAKAPSSNDISALTPGQRLRQVEQQIKNLQASSAAAKVDGMQAELRSLRGEVEALEHELDQLKTIQKSMYSDLQVQMNQLLAKVNTGPVPAAHGALSQDDSDNEVPTNVPRDTVPVKSVKLLSTASASAISTPLTVKTVAKTNNQDQPDAAQEQQIYQTAYDLIKAKKYNEAIVALRSMLKKYPTGQFAANAHYWLGELYGLLNKNDQSVEEFATVVKNYPESPKAADAQLKLGLIYVGEFKWADAKSAFKKVLSSSPGTASARLAMEQLKQIKKAGH